MAAAVGDAHLQRAARSGNAGHGSVSGDGSRRPPDDDGQARGSRIRAVLHQVPVVPGKDEVAVHLDRAEPVPVRQCPAGTGTGCSEPRSGPGRRGKAVAVR
ncbi:hypothetical protein BL253_31380 [Pseudofrankia asymbiotica]|uniref:Uncharacterized protein n=1 Tax=Pseudofrankia asymbiotica TaxID=1834516 RepID=A0A1V2I2H9_9ACTN|nr:hypothetical protein BL253_31380 [Pseudofrankia asymbiotica]